ncbi:MULTISPECIES: radical SAM protein [Acetobacter]|uniref:Radical SAM core domain-containing protein n=1 Tax=Acetobacter tropicalis TaxID=104102 RepID=A0A291PNB4_9PROT|nr:MULTISPECIES: radical SAM protein [Acetobacter]ATJ92905.1 hypothetical protein CIW82_18880 [Acetobacter tropicalis]MCG4274372.1 radical SAM protein [Acetobacter senegalensis]
MKTHSNILYNSLTDEKLTLTILPTEQCNFRCVYCYEDFKIGKMRPDIINGIKNLISIRAPDLRILNLSWFGGEPLLAADIIRDIDRHASDICTPNNTVLTFNITTNGSLLTENFIIETDMLGRTKYQISFDGDEEEHNKSRILANGSPTFHSILEKIILFQKLVENKKITRSKVMLRLHLSPGKLEGTWRFLTYVSKHLDPTVFSILLKNVGKYGGKNDRDLRVFEEHEHAVVLFRQKAIEVFPDFFQKPTSSTPVCYACEANSFVIRADGRLAKCTVALGRSENTIGKILPSGELLLDTKKHSPWLEPLISLEPEKLACPLPSVLSKSTCV